MNEVTSAAQDTAPADQDLTVQVFADLLALFDAAHYRARAALDADIGDADALRHFLSTGWLQGVDPSPEFSLAAYRAFYPDQAGGDVNPFLHFVTIGRHQGCVAHPLAAARDLSAAALDATRGPFDPDHYRSQIDADDMTDHQALCHFMAYGWKDGLDPARGFSTRHYISENPDIAASGTNPFLHYQIAGRYEGRSPHPLLPACDQKNAIKQNAVDKVKPHFDPGFYREMSPELAVLGGLDLLVHYMHFGWREGLNPSPDFDTAYYLSTNPDIAKAKVNPLLHYVLHGRNEGRFPSFEAEETARLAAEAAEIEPDFDPDHYASQVPELIGQPINEMVQHYLEEGWQDGLDPSPSFSTDFYIENNPDVSETGINPLLHYVRTGKAEGRKTQAAKGRDYGPADLDAARPFFDAGYYREHVGNVGETDDDLLYHYLTVGWKEHNDPSPRFSTKFYLNSYPDIRNAGLNPLLHYALAGRAEGRQAFSGQPIRDFTEEAARRVRPFFDADFYRQAHPTLSDRFNDDDLLTHFMQTGWRQNLDPSPDFSTKYYLETYPDIAKNNLNPLMHYAVSGKAEGRACHPSAVVNDVSESDLKQVEPYFDAEFYRALYDDVKGTDRELLIHYMTVGWREERDPAQDFSTSHYLETYGDIQRGGINPLLHYAVSGKAEGRRPLAKGAVSLRVDPNADIVKPHFRPILGLGPDVEVARLPADHKANPAAMTLHWIVPDFNRGGGGHMTIFRMIRHLETFGHRCKIWILSPTVHMRAEDAYDDIVKYFQCVEAEVDFIENGFAQATGDAVIATSWETAYVADATQGFAAKFYFVQDHEVEFYPTGTERLLAQRTYEFDFAAICASPWLEKIMREKYGQWARHFYLAYDHDYYEIPDSEKHAARFSPERAGPVRIAVYARGHTARRCVDLALIALDKLADRDVDFEVHFYGTDRLPFSATRFPAFTHGVIEAGELAELYRSCDLGVCFSATNYSLVPQEMMACGLPLLELDTESTREIFPDDVVTLAGPDPSDIADKLADMIRNTDARRAQSQAAYDWVSRFTWEGAARAVESALASFVTEETPHAGPAVHRSRETMLDVVIPTYDGMGELEPVIEALRGQADADLMQIHCIDSSSSDGTTEWLRAQSDIATTVIDQSAFQHGRTRNQAIAQGSAPFIGVLTQDAMPATAFWATDILKMMHHFPNAAGLFGRHKPYPDHPEYVREQILTHFQNMLRHPLAVSKFTDPEKWDAPDRGWHQFLHFYSDNNSAMRRSVWQDIPYPEVDYGEDQVWAYEIIKAGHTKLYAPTAVVYHSHDYDPEETFKRSRTEGAFFHTHFGYELGQGTEQQVSGRIAREQREFRKWARKRHVDEAEFEMRQKNIAEKYRGWREGVAQSKAQSA
ncbi:MAG: glycosyltransferase [Pseudomonadota bacterium]